MVVARGGMIKAVTVLNYQFITDDDHFESAINACFSAGSCLFLDKMGVSEFLISFSILLICLFFS